MSPPRVVSPAGFPRTTSDDPAPLHTPLDGPINGEWFEAYVRHVLLPELRPGDVEIMDTLSSHKRPAVRELMGAVGATLMCLPPYSPDFTPASLYVIRE